MTVPPAPSASLVHSLIASGLSDPQRLQEWSARPDLVERYGVDPSTLDLATLADFAGLSEKVRHNQCREHLPLTFRLIRLAGVEVELFRCYAPRSRQRHGQGLTSVTDRLDGLAEFVEEWAAGGESLRILIRDVLWHEHVISVFRRVEIAPDAGPKLLATGGGTIPLLDGRIVVRQATCDPLQVAQVLSAREPDLSAIERAPWTFVYHRAPAGSVRILAVDRGVAELLLVVDGRSSVEAIADRLLGDIALVPALRSTLEELADLGLLTWRGDGRVPCA